MKIREKSWKPFMDAIKQVPRYDFLQGNESVSMRASWFYATKGVSTRDQGSKEVS